MTQYEKLSKEAKHLFDFINEFWTEEEENGYASNALDYADVEYATSVFETITGLTLEEVTFDKLMS